MTRYDGPAEGTSVRQTLRGRPAFAAGAAGQLQETTGASRAIVAFIIGVTGFVAAMYLLAEALYAIFLSVVFGSDILQSSTVEYLAFIAKAAIPAFCFAALCATGLRFWPSGRFWALGLSAIVVETALAIYALVHPESTLLFFV